MKILSKRKIKSTINTMRNRRKKLMKNIRKSVRCKLKILRKYVKLS